MPERANRICQKAACGAVIPGDRMMCPTHRTQYRRAVTTGQGRASGRTRGAGRISPALRTWVANKAKHLCAQCRKPGSEVDHIQPTHLEGADHSSNLQWLCRNCHALKTGTENAKRFGLRRAEKKDQGGAYPVGRGES